MANETTIVIAKKTRWYRKWHRRIGLFVGVFLLFISVTGILLVWKKNSGGYLLADSHKGMTTNLADWLTFDSLAANAVTALQSKYGKNISTQISRIDARPDKGMVKFLFEGHYHGIQLDASTGKVLHLEERRADFIEQLHDGSIIDNLFGTNGYSKLVYGSLAGFGLLILSVSGFWLWYNPRVIKKTKQAGKTQPAHTYRNEIP